jgi:hypothetical protein
MQRIQEGLYEAVLKSSEDNVVNPNEVVFPDTAEGFFEFVDRGTGLPMLCELGDMFSLETVVDFVFTSDVSSLSDLPGTIETPNPVPVPPPLQQGDIRMFSRLLNKLNPLLRFVNLACDISKLPAALFYTYDRWGENELQGTAYVQGRTTDNESFRSATTSFEFGVDQVIEVNTGDKPQITDFIPTPRFISAGEASSLTWNVSSDKTFTLTIEPNVGDVSNVNSVTVLPTETTTYTLTANNGDCESTATATVTVDDEEEENNEEDNVDEACQDCIEGSNIGDPRYRTFDGLFYEFQGVGEYILLESLDDDLVIQTRQAPWRDSTTVSINSGVAAQVGTDRVGIYVDQASELYINGEPTELASGERRQLDGGSVRREDNRYTVMWADQTTLVTSLRSDFMDLRVLIAPERAGRVVGLLGDANGSRANDLATREGSVFEQPLTFEQLYQEYGNSWRISQEESLLDYLGEAAGIGTAFYTDFNFPSTVPTVTDEALAFAEEVCNAADITDPILLEACILDVAITGDPSFAEGYGEIAPPEELLPVPTVPPVVRLTEPLNGSTVRGNISVSGSLESPQAIASLTYRLNDANPVEVSQQITGTTFAFTIAGNAFIDGSNTLRVVAETVDGVRGTFVVTLTYNPDGFDDDVVVVSGDNTIAAGTNHSLAITADGNLWAWGGNRIGQLGDGTFTFSYVPVRVAGLSNVQQIAAGPRHSLAITADGNLWAWGDNFDGQLGDGTTTSSSVPVRVAGLRATQQTSLVR